MTATIKIDMDNAAFEDGTELAARLIHRRLEAFCEQRKGRMILGCFDINGNKVGELEIK